MRTPPQPPPRWNYTPEAMIETAHKLVTKSNEVWQRIEMLDAKEITFETAVLPLIYDEQDMQFESSAIDFLEAVSPSKELRDAASAVSKILGNAKLNRTSNRVVYRHILTVCNSNENLDPESSLYLSNLKQEFEENGLGLHNCKDATRLQEIRHAIKEKGQAYINNLQADDSGLWFTQDELAGVPTSHLERWNQDDKGRLWVNYKRPNETPVLEYAANGYVREQVWTGSENRFKDSNGPLLQDVVLLRDEAARLLGYVNHADFMSRKRMLKPQTVDAFLQGLRQKITPKGKAEIEELKILKSKHLQSSAQALQNNTDVGNPHSSDKSSDKLYLWDRFYYDRMKKDQSITVNNDEVAEFFNFETIIPKMLNIYELLFGLKFVKQRTDIDEGSCWHQDVTLFNVWDDENEGGQFVGYMYMDPFPRPNKYNHFGVYRLLPGHVQANGERSFPCSIFLANYTPPTPSKPSLLRYKEVVSCFHELGHAVHNITCYTKYAKSVQSPRDFIEIPSILMEYLFWDPNTIRALSGHYSDPTIKISDDLIHGSIEANDINPTLPVLHLIYQSLFDLTIHSQPDRQSLEKLNLATAFNTIRKETQMIDGPEALGKGYDFFHGHTHFRAIMGGYDAGYYTYVTSRAYAYDIFHSIFAPLQTTLRTNSIEEIINEKMRAAGRRWRHMVLEKGGSTGNEMQLLRELLGREPNHDAFGNLEKFKV